MKLSRRHLLLLAGGGLAVAGAGYAGLRSYTDADLVRLVLERHLGPLNMAERDLQAFVASFRERGAWRFPTAKLADATALLEEVDLASAARGLLPDDDAVQVERFERWLLADFYLLTDYAWRTAAADPVRFVGSEACTNPFARFELA